MLELCNDTVFPESAWDAIALEEWELQLLILVVINEGGSQTVEQVEYITWTILNRYVNDNIQTDADFGSRMESILLSNPIQFHVVFGDPGEGFPGGIFEGNLAGTGPIGPMAVEDAYSSQLLWNPYLNDENIDIVSNVVSAFNDGARDPTNGADSFFHVDAGQGLTSSFERRNEVIDPSEFQGSLRSALATGYLPGNGRQPPYGLSRDMVFWRQFSWP